MPEAKANAPAMKGSQSVQRGWKAYSQGDLARAESEFSKALSEAPATAFAVLQQGLFRLRQDRFAEASGSFEAAVAIEQNNPAPLFFLALSRELEGNADLADRDLLRLAELCPRHQGLTSLRLLKEMRRGDPLPSLHLLGFGQDPKPKASWRVAMAGLGVGDPAWLVPDLSSSQYLLGPILLEVERRLLPREIPVLEHRTGNLLASIEGLKPPERKLREELASLKNSWKSGPKLRKGRQLLERAMGIENLDEQRAQLARAIALLEEGHNLDRFAFRTSYHLGEAYLFSAKSIPGSPYLRDPLSRAESYFVESAGLDGLNPYVLFYLALIQQLLGRPQPAIDCYAKATEKFTKLPEAHYGTGQCYLLLGQPQQAREFLLKAANSDLALARERLTLFATLLQNEGPEAVSLPLPSMPAEIGVALPADEPVAALEPPLAEAKAIVPDAHSVTPSTAPDEPSGQIEATSGEPETAPEST
jgi:tetratricopeptide (TPR) repeat protein